MDDVLERTWKEVFIVYLRFCFGSNVENYVSDKQCTKLITVELLGNNCWNRNTKKCVIFLLLFTLTVAINDTE